MRKIKVGRKTLKTTPVYDTYWRFASQRFNIFMKRIKNQKKPWTNDPILNNYRFTNVYRVSDRVSQYLVKNVIYQGPQSVEEIFFRTILFKIFNKIETWETLSKDIGEITWSSYSFQRYVRALEQRKKVAPIYSAAYIMPSPQFGSSSKHRNHLRLLEYMMKVSIFKEVAKAKSLKDVYEILLNCPSLGKFLAFQFSIDLNYSEIINFSEMDFVVAGPGARDGIMKCFQPGHGVSPEEIIRVVTDRAFEEFCRLGLNFQTLRGRPLQLIDCQNLFCEVAKYARIAHPDFPGETNRKKIKQRYSKDQGDIPQWYPPKWHINNKKESSLMCA